MSTQAISPFTITSFHINTPGSTLATSVAVFPTQTSAPKASLSGSSHVGAIIGGIIAAIIAIVSLFGISVCLFRKRR